MHEVQRMAGTATTLPSFLGEGNSFESIFLFPFLGTGTMLNTYYGY